MLVSSLSSSIAPQPAQVKASQSKFGLQHYINFNNRKQPDQVSSFNQQITEALGGKGLHSFAYKDETGKEQEENIFVGATPDGVVQILTSGSDSVLTQAVCTDQITGIDGAIKKIIRSILDPFDNQPDRSYTISGGRYSPSIPQKIAGSPETTLRELGDWKEKAKKDGFAILVPSTRDGVNRYSPEGEMVNSHSAGI